MNRRDAIKLLLMAPTGAVIAAVGSPPRAPISLKADFLFYDGAGVAVVLLTWQNLHSKKDGVSLTVERGIFHSLAGDPFWGSKYSTIRWLFSKRVPTTSQMFLDALPAGTDLATVRYRVIATNRTGSASSAVVGISP